MLFKPVCQASISSREGNGKGLSHTRFDLFQRGVKWFLLRRFAAWLYVALWMPQRLKFAIASHIFIAESLCFVIAMGDAEPYFTWWS